MASLQTELTIKNQCAQNFQTKEYKPPTSETSDNSKYTEWNDVVSNVFSENCPSTILKKNQGEDSHIRNFRTLDERLKGRQNITNSIIARIEILEHYLLKHHDMAKDLTHLKSEVQHI